MKRMDTLVGALELAFYGLALLALIVGLTAGPGWGLLLLLLAGAAHAARAGVEDAGLVRVDGRSRALPILRRGGAGARRGALAAWKGAAVAQGTASSAWSRARAAQAERSAPAKRTAPPARSDKAKRPAPPRERAGRP